MEGHEKPGRAAEVPYGDKVLDLGDFHALDVRTRPPIGAAPDEARPSAQAPEVKRSAKRENNSYKGV